MVFIAYIVHMRSNLGAVKKQKSSQVPQAMAGPADLVEPLEQSADEADDHQGGYVSSDEEEDGQDSVAVQELQEEICRLHAQVQLSSLLLSHQDGVHFLSLCKSAYSLL